MGGEPSTSRTGSLLGLDLGRRYGGLGFFGDGGEIVYKKIPAGPDFVERACALAGFIPGVLVIPGGSYVVGSQRVFPVGEEIAALARGCEDSWHPRNLLTCMAWEYGAKAGCKVMAVGTMTGAPLSQEARLSGLPGYCRRTVYHVLEHREAIRAAGEATGENLAQKNVIVVYSGEETSVACHAAGTVVECTDPLAGEGPFGLRAAGTLPATALVDAFFANQLGDNPEELLSCRSGVMAYAGTTDEEELASLVEGKDEKSLRAVRGMAYQICKEIGRAVATLAGAVDLIILAGPVFSLGEVVDFVRLRVEKWAPVTVVAGELVIPALLRAVAGGG